MKDCFVKDIVRAGLVAAALGVAAPVLAQETSLTFATVNPPSAHLTKNILIPWAEKVNETEIGRAHV